MKSDAMTVLGVILGGVLICGFAAVVYVAWWEADDLLDRVMRRRRETRDAQRYLDKQRHPSTQDQR